MGGATEEVPPWATEMRRPDLARQIRPSGTRRRSAAIPLAPRVATGSVRVQSDRRQDSEIARRHDECSRALASDDHVSDGHGKKLNIERMIP